MIGNVISPNQLGLMTYTSYTVLRSQLYTHTRTRTHTHTHTNSFIHLSTTPLDVSSSVSLRQSPSSTLFHLLYSPCLLLLSFHFIIFSFPLILSISRLFSRPSVLFEFCQFWPAAF